MRFVRSVLIAALLLPITMVLAQDDWFQEITETWHVSDGKPLELWLDVDAGEVIVERGNSPGVVELYMKFTEGEFKEKIKFDEKRNKLRIQLDKRNWNPVKRGSDFDEDDIWALLELKLPGNVEIYFDSKIKAGEITMLLGGLKLGEFYFHNWAGEVELRFDEPNLIPMETLDINAIVGEVRLLGLGNARFEKANINGGIGELYVDFSGDLTDKSEARVDLEIGEATVVLPQEYGIKMRVGGGLSFLSHKNIDHSFYRRGNAWYSEDYEESGKHFFVRITPGLGELNVERD